MRTTRWRALSTGLAAVLLSAPLLTACAQPGPDIYETTVDFEAFEAELRAAQAARDAMGVDPPGPAWDDRVPLPATAGWERRSGCDLWLTALGCTAWLGGGADFEEMRSTYVAALQGEGWTRFDEETEVVGQDLWTFVSAEHPSWTLYLSSTGDYEGRAPALVVRALLPLPARDAALSGGGLSGTAEVVPDAGESVPGPWSPETPGQAPVPGVAAQYCESDILLLRCVARARELSEYAGALSAAGWVGFGGGDALTAFRDPAHGDSVVYLQTGPSSVEVRAYIDANAPG